MWKDVSKIQLTPYSAAHRPKGGHNLAHFPGGRYRPS